MFFVVFREFDVLHHFFWGQDLKFYKLIDGFLGGFLLPSLERQGIGLAIVSDHGVTPVEKAVNVERLLEGLGYDEYYSVGGWGALYQNPKSQISIHRILQCADFIDRNRYDIAGLEEHSASDAGADAGW